jgi:hypothetical protein
MSLVSPEIPLPVGSFSKTNPPKNLAFQLRNPLPPKYIKAHFHVRNGGFVSEKHMFVRTSLAILPQSIPQDTVIVGHGAEFDDTPHVVFPRHPCRLGIVPRRALEYALRCSFAVRPVPSCVRQRVAL